MSANLHSPLTRRAAVAGRWLAMAAMTTAVQRLAALTTRWRARSRVLRSARMYDRGDPDAEL